MIKIVVLAFLLASCSYSGSKVVPIQSEADTGIVEPVRPSNRRMSRTQPGVECLIIEFDPSEKFDENESSMTEMEYLFESCYLEHRWSIEYVYCMYGEPGSVAPVPSRLVKSYPCSFSDEYMRNFGDPEMK